MFRAFRNFLHLVLGEAGGTLLRDLIRGELKGGAGVLAERIREIVKQDPRANLVLTLLFMDSGERANIMEARRHAKGEGWENRFIRDIAKLLPLKEGHLDEGRAREILAEFNKISPEEMEQFLEFLNHDPIAEWFRYWILGKGKEVAVQASEVLAELVGLGIRFAEQIPEAARITDDWATNTAAPAVRRFRTSQKWLKPSRRRRRRLESQAQEQQEQLRQQREQQTRERVAELYDRLRRDFANRRGEQG